MKLPTQNKNGKGENGSRYSVSWSIRSRGTKTTRLVVLGKDQVIDLGLTSVLFACFWIFIPTPQSATPISAASNLLDNSAELVDPALAQRSRKSTANLDAHAIDGALVNQVPANDLNPPPVRAKSHTRYLTVATMLRNERRWVREWIEFNLMMGVQHFIIYDNGSTDLPLEILQYYIDEGLVTYIPWPPASVPPPPAKFRTPLDEWQYSWFRDCLETCLSDDWAVHRHAPCQYAAFSDAIRRTKNGTSRWLGIYDVDEYIFPRPTSNFRSISGLLREKYRHADVVVVPGGTFGTSGHVDHAAQREPGSPLHALITEEYTLRAEFWRISLFVEHANSSGR